MSSNLIWHGDNPNQGDDANFVSYESVVPPAGILDAQDSRPSCVQCTLEKASRLCALKITIFYSIIYSECCVYIKRAVL